MKDNKDIYNKNFFNRASELEEPSAQAVALILIKYFNPKSVIDIGCGIGIYLKEFSKRGVEILGYDNSPEAIRSSLVGEKIKFQDLRKPLILERKFDLCLCVEVAEHLPSESVSTLVETLSGLSNVIFFTAATPGQGSLEIGHINEQPNEYWIEKFAEHHFMIDKEMTENIRKEMKEENVIWWVVRNLIIFKKNL
ncbi:MAG: class I SAM-dependent methyltransferase [Candidatus Paceibacterota bacterium]